MTVRPSLPVRAVRKDAVRLPAASAAPPLRPWSRIWRYLVALGVGLLFWIFTVAEYIGPNPDSLPADENAAIGAFAILDLVLGLIATALLPLRRRFPLLVAVLTACLSAVSVFSVGPAMLAIVSMSTRRRWRPVVVVGLVWIVCTLFYEFVLRPSVPGVASEVISRWASGGVAVAVYAICVSTGFYIGARRDLLASLRERARTAEREQALREDSAREAERTRIAREMHDVLAHHISLVSLHAGALTYRTDLTRDETAEAAAVIQNNAQLALTELRQILGVLRDVDGGAQARGASENAFAEDEGRAEPPQPTLAALPALVADGRDAGMRVTTDADGLALDDLSESVSRTAYRIIQEALTNARKHAPGAPVTVRLERRDDELWVTARNSVGHASAGLTAGSGMGLTGLQERAELAGGTLAHGIDSDGSFVVAARLPWA